MATRCSIEVLVFDNNALVNKCYLYKHWDGYPSNVLERIKKVIEKRKVGGDREILSALFSEFDGEDELQLSREEWYGTMMEEYLYSIQVGTMRCAGAKQSIRVAVGEEEHIRRKGEDGVWSWF